MICIMAGILIAVALYSVNRQKAFMESCSKELKASLLQAQEVKCDLEEMMLNTINMSRDLVDDLERRMNVEAEPEPAVLTVDQTMLEYRAESQAFSKAQPQETRPEKISIPAGLISKPRLPEMVESPDLLKKKPDAAASEVMTMPAAVFNSRLQFSATDHNEAPATKACAGTACGPRVHELAEELKTSSKEILNICRQMGLSVNHHMKVLNAEQVAAIKAQWFFGEQYVAPPQASFQPNIVSPIGASPEKIEFNKIGSDRGRQFSMNEIKQAHPYLAVRTLCEQGYDQKEIARILGRGESEINLIMNLTKRKMVSNA